MYGCHLEITSLAVVLGQKGPKNNQLQKNCQLYDKLNQREALRLQWNRLSHHYDQFMTVEQKLLPSGFVLSAFVSYTE